MNNKYKILVVDDDKFLTDFYMIKLRKSGYDVDSLNQAGDDFVEKVSEIKPDLITLDIIMPGMDGFDALKLLKADERTKNIPVMGLDNLGTKDVVDQIVQCGAIDYLLKAALTPSRVVEILADYFSNPNEYSPLYKQYKYKGDAIVY